jgi:hypothetical protein
VGKIVINGKQVEVAGSPPSLLELVDEVEKKHVEKDWIVVEVAVNGERIEGYSGPDGVLTPYDPDADIDITAHSRVDLLVNILHRFEKYLERLIPGMKHLVELFRSGEEEKANRLYRDAIEGIRVLAELIMNIHETGMVSDAAISPEGKGLSDLAGDLKGTLEELVAAQTESDSERIADALEFELITQLETWQQAMPELRRLVESQQGG